MLLGMVKICYLEFKREDKIINILKIISLDYVPSLKDNIYIHVCHTKRDAENEATIEELNKAVYGYIKNMTK